MIKCFLYKDSFSAAISRADWGQKLERVNGGLTGLVAKEMERSGLFQETLKDI